MFKKYWRVTALSAAVLFTAQPSLSATCDAILAHGITNITIKKSARASIATKYHNHCHKKFSSMNAETLADISVEVLGYGGGEANFNTTKTSSDLLQWCKTNKELAESSADLYEESRSLYGEAVRAWNDCKALNKDGLKVDVKITPNNQAVAVGLRYTNPGKVSYMGYEVRGFVCSEVIAGGGIASAKTPVAISTGAINLSCTRNDPLTVSLAGGDYKVQDWGQVNMFTTAGPVQVYFTELTEPTAPTAEVLRLNSEITDLKMSIKNLTQVTEMADQALNERIKGLSVEIVHRKRYHTEKQHILPVKADKTVCTVGGLQGRLGNSGDNAYFRTSKSGHWVLDLHTDPDPNLSLRVEVICFKIK
ncbi:hypothetical protein SAMN06265368_4061 [Cohaesibacter gelatinilyticus]|uniref:Uncharacterized protein n=1 Tax=Cohaesibacter gelatinilyticus TaxID=372072 RepID=A0A285PI75_9HYPH|nr:hypothetical protein SAMN06265368_4061 [Cohaesibacter gelatinilyticus]